MTLRSADIPSDARTANTRVLARDSTRLRARAADRRVSCTDCRNYRPGRCGNHRRAGLMVADVGRDLAVMPPHCPGFATNEDAR